jgi:hypothetical protein
LSVNGLTSVHVTGSFVKFQSQSVSCPSYHNTGSKISVGFSIVVIFTLSSSTFLFQSLFKNALNKKFHVQAEFNPLNEYKFELIVYAEFDSVTHVIVVNQFVQLNHFQFVQLSYEI